MAEDRQEPLFGAHHPQADDDAREAYRRLERRSRPDPSDFSWAHRVDPQSWEEEPALSAPHESARPRPPRRQPRGVVVIVVLVAIGAVVVGVRMVRSLSDSGVGTVIGVYARGGPPVQLEAGDCVDLDAGESAVDAVAPSRCDLPHDAEVVGVVALDDRADHPGAEVIRQEGGAACADAFARHAGAPLAADGPLVLHVLHPSADGWEAGDRRVTCLARDRHGAPLFAPAREIAAGTS